MRVGLVGTGPWAKLAHGPGLRAAEGVELVGVWGRDGAKAAAVGEQLGTEGFDDYGRLLEACDAVAFAVPPDVQAAMAVEAAAVGKHLLLDKPVALTVDDARAIAAEVADEGVASVVFFTDRFAPEVRDWHAGPVAAGGWRGGWVRMLASLDAAGNPFGNSPWRRDRGALWDVGPHALSNLMATLGPVTGLTAVGGAGDLVHLVIGHESGATSTATLTLFAPEPAGALEIGLWGDSGTAMFPARTTSAIDALALAATELVRCAESGEPHPVDAAFGARVVELLADAERQLDANQSRASTAT
jgi:predicted dehydrogenase